MGPLHLPLNGTLWLTGEMLQYKPLCCFVRFKICGTYLHSWKQTSFLSLPMFCVGISGLWGFAGVYVVNSRLGRQVAVSDSLFAPLRFFSSSQLHPLSFNFSSTFLTQYHSKLRFLQDEQSLAIWIA